MRQEKETTMGANIKGKQTARGNAQPGGADSPLGKVDSQEKSERDGQGEQTSRGNRQQGGTHNQGE